MSREELLRNAKPILFNTEMVRAILDGRKTVTRRICKDGNDYTVPDMGFYNADKRTYAIHSYCDKRCTYEYQIATSERRCPICPGDILYVRETWYKDPYRYLYRANYSKTEKFYCNGEEIEMKWHPSIHMPKEAARIFLKFKNVRVERLQEITEEQAEKEGAIDNRGFIHSPENEYNNIHTAKEHFEQIWNSTIKKSDFDRYGWDANPYVFVIEFERIEVTK